MPEVGCIVNVLITGGLGFQGRHLAWSWSQQHNVVLLATPSHRALGVHHYLVGRCVVTFGSILMPHLVDKLVEGMDVIVHLAAVANPEMCRERPGDAVLTQIRGTQIVMEAARKYGCRVIHASSCEVYGEPLTNTPQTEDAPFHPPHMYGMSKAGADLLVQAYAREYKIQATIMRPCNIFGPWQESEQRYGAVIPRMVNAARMKMPIIVHGGTQRREFLYVKDLVRAYTCVLERPVPGAFNVGGESVSIGAIASLIAKRFHATIEVKEPRVAEPQSFMLDDRLFRETYGWQRTLSFEEGLNEYILDATGRGPIPS